MNMSHGMSNIPTFRRGRSVFIGDRRMTSCQKYLIGTILVAATIAIIVFVAVSESNKLTLVRSFDEIKGHIEEFDVDHIGRHYATVVQSVGKNPIHFSSKHIHSSVFEPDFNFVVKNAINLVRNTEYCQWSEFFTDSCDTCYRDVRQDNGRTKTESYSCNCVRTYNYIKSWQKFRVNSFLFDQPAAHHNPQRDPFPSTTIYSNDAYIGQSFALEPDLIKKIQGKSQWVMWDRIDAQRELNHVYDSLAHRQFGFTYAGNGYFFSPYETSTQEWIAKKFFQWMEGSILDYQLGDLVPSCVAGDIRVWYTMISPRELSGIGKVALIGDGTAASIGVLTTPKGFEVGSLREGLLTATQLMDSDIWDRTKLVYISRLVSFLWALLITSIEIRYFDCVEVGFGPYLLHALSMAGVTIFIANAWVSGSVYRQDLNDVNVVELVRGQFTVVIAGLTVSMTLFLLTAKEFQRLGKAGYDSKGDSMSK